MAHILVAAKREPKHAQKVRASGKIPAVVYGPQIGSQAITLEHMPFLKLLNDVGESTLIELSIDSGDKHQVLIQDVQFDPVNNAIVHVDLRQIEMGKPIEAEIELEFIGEAPAVKTYSGVLVKNIDSITVRCLPKNLPSSITVDLSSLTELEKPIHVSDLPIGEGVEVLGDVAESVATVLPQQEEEEVEAEPVDVANIEVEKKGKKEEEGAEGGEAK